MMCGSKLSYISVFSLFNISIKLNTRKTQYFTYCAEYEDNPPTSESPPTQDKQTHRLRTRRALNREARALSKPRSE